MIANSDTSEIQKSSLRSHVIALSEGGLSQLAIAFDQFPQAINTYYNYIDKTRECKPMTSEQLEKLLTRIIDDSGLDG